MDWHEFGHWRIWKKLWAISVLIRRPIGLAQLPFYPNIYMHVCAHLAKYLSVRKMFQTKVVEKNETYILCPEPFRCKSYVNQKWREFVSEIARSWISHGLLNTIAAKERKSVHSLYCVEIIFLIVWCNVLLQRVMLATIQSKTFCLLVCSLKT
jgi:hypothetical protein